MSFLLGIGSKVWGYLAAAVGVLAAIAVIFKRGERAGADKVTTGVNAASADASKRMVEAAVGAPSSVDPVIKDMKGGKF